MEELYINDKKVDLGDARITLNHKSNLLGDITTINASNSLTIRLPKTVRNREILDCPDQPSYSGKYLRKYIDAQYFRNGIEILKGFAVLLSSSDTYEICLSWGELFELTEFLNEDDMLNEYLNDNKTIYWDFGYITGNNDYGGFYDCGVNDITKIAPHPSVFVSDILQKIQDKSGLVFKFPQETTEWLADKKVLCTTRMHSKKQLESDPALFYARGLNRLESNPQYYKLILRGGRNADYVFEHDETTENANIISIGSGVLKNMSLGFNIHLNHTGGYRPTDVKLHIRNKPLGEDSTFEIIAPFTYDSGLNDFVLNRSIEIDTPKGSYYFYVYINISVLSITDDRLRITFAFEDNSGGYGQVSYPGYFPPYINLPEISLADFVKNISALTGTFPHRYKSDPTNVITFSPLEIIYQNKSKGIDWSDKLIFRGHPKEVGYKVNDMARKNYLQYKEDEQVSTRGRGVIEVNDETLTREKDLFDMAFSASDSVPADQFDLAYIRQYELDGENINEININPRILSSFVNNNSRGLSFAGMSFYDIVKTRYQGYQRIMREPIVLKEDFRLTELDIKNIDFTIPIFLRQYGRYYAVMSIQDTNGICNVELLQLN